MIHVLRSTSWRAALASGAFHGALLLVLGLLKPPAPKAPPPKPIAVRMAAPPPPPPPVAVVEPPPVPKTPEKPRPPRVRQKRQPQPTPPAPPPPPVAGLSESLRTDGVKGQGPAVAVGNSAEVAVRPDQPPNPPLADGASGDYPPQLVPVAESAADVPAKCPPLPEVQLGSDALNAGITSGTVVVEVQMGADGKAHSPVLKKGTGFSVDKKVLEAARKIVCKPALKNGQPVPLKAKRLVWEIRE